MNTDDDPQFRDEVGLDFRLRSTSPARDTGLHDGASVPFPFADQYDADLDGNLAEAVPGLAHGTRVVLTHVDMGAYEFSCPADITGPDGAGNPDGNVDSLDFLLLIGQWGSPCTGSCEADMTGPTPLVPDGNVDSLDYLLLIAQWGNPGNCPDTEQAQQSAGGGPDLTMDEWMILAEALQSEELSERAAAECWLEHFMQDCAHGCRYSGCPGADPTGRHH